MFSLPEGVTNRGAVNSGRGAPGVRSPEEGQFGQAVPSGTGHHSLNNKDLWDFNKKQAIWFRQISESHSLWCPCGNYRNHFNVRPTEEKSTSTEPLPESENPFGPLFREAERARIKGIKRKDIAKTSKSFGPFKKEKKKAKKVKFADTGKHLPIPDWTEEFSLRPKAARERAKPNLDPETPLRAPYKTPKRLRLWLDGQGEDTTSSEEEDGDTEEDSDTTEENITENVSSGVSGDLINLLSGRFSTSTPAPMQCVLPTPTIQ